MPGPTSNIEPLARAICESQLRPVATSETQLAADVDRYWHCIAAQIEAGLIDDEGRPVDRDIDRGLNAYIDWRQRHPEYVLPSRYPPQG